jgi:hypothetical protein
MSWKFLRALRNYIFRLKSTPDGSQIVGRLRELSEPDKLPKQPHADPLDEQPDADL